MRGLMIDEILISIIVNGIQCFHNQEELHEVLSTIESAQADGLLRAAHRVHLRCEICADNVVSQMASVMDRHRLDLISLMDHTPGQRQFVQEDKYRTYYQGKFGHPCKC